MTLTSRDIQAIMACAVRHTPALAVPGLVRSSGALASGEELAGWLSEAARETGR